MCGECDATTKHDNVKQEGTCLVVTTEAITLQVGEEHITKEFFHSNCIAKVNKADNHIIQQQYVCSSGVLPFLDVLKK